MLTTVIPRGATIADVSPGSLLLPPVAATILLWITSTNPFETSASVYAFLLLLIPWGSYLCWRKGRRDGLPMFAMVGGAYWVYFALALFWGQRVLYLAGTVRFFVPSEAAITDAMLMAVLGVVFLWIGMRVPVSIWVPEHLPDVIDRGSTWTYVRAILIAGMLFGLSAKSEWLLGAGGRQAMITFMTVVPNAAFVLLFSRYLSGAASRGDRATLIVAAGIRVVGGLISGWLASVVGIGVICAAVMLLKRRRLPWAMIGVTIVLILFLQAGKSEFRTLYWDENQESYAGLTERVTFWLEKSATMWANAFSSGDNELAQNLASQSLQRASLLTQAAHVIEVTPSQVPFQLGDTYSYFSVALIPRFMWPDKPSINEANRFYQLAYGLTNERGLDSTSIAIGALVEGYINFGWTGVAGAMFLVGFVLGVYERTFGLTQSSTLFLAIGLTLVPGFLAVEAQLGQYFAGVIQQAVLAIAVFLPIAARRGNRRGASSISMSPVHSV